MIVSNVRSLAVASIPRDMIETINMMVRLSRQEIRDTGREPTLEELAKRLAVPLDKVRRVVDIAKMRIRI